MGGFLPVDVQIAVGEHRTAYRTYADGFLLQPHVAYNLGHEFVHHAMGTARAIVHRRVIHQFRLRIHEVLR